MKRMLLMMLLGLLAGCASGPMRTGKICVNPVLSDGYSTSDPIDIKPDVVVQVASMLQKEIIAQIGADSALVYVTDCAVADYVLSTKIKSLDAKTDINHSFLLSRSRVKREYILGAVASLETNNKISVINNIFASDNNDHLPDAIESVAGDIIGEIRELPKSVSTTQKTTANE